MSRAGREPAEDVKRRLVAACTEVGLQASGNMRLIGDERLIWVTASPIELIARVPITGDWPATIDVRCGVSANLNEPFLRGRSQVPFDDLVAELQETLNEREQVIAAMRMGIDGPYRFERSVWCRPDLLG